MEQPVRELLSTKRDKPEVAKGGKLARRQRFALVALVLSDAGLALAVWQAAMMLQSIFGRGPLSEITAASVVPLAAIWIGLRALLGLYPGYGLAVAEELRRQTYAAAATLASAAVFIFAFQVGDLTSRLLVAFSFLGLLVLAPMVRALVKWELHRFGLWGKPVIVLGGPGAGEQILRLLREEWHLGYRPLAFFDNNEGPTSGAVEGVPYGGTLTDAMFSGWDREVDTVIFAMPYTRRARLAKYVQLASERFRHVMLIPNLSGITNSAVEARDLSGVFSVEIKYNLLNPWSLRAKRALDLGATLVGGLLILPLILTLCLLVWLESGGSIFYRDHRTGRNGKPFSCVKFRTMVPDAEGLLSVLLRENPEMRSEYMKYHKLRRDPRVTRVGRFLRKTSLDELPQLWNVLKGEMSLVGPRPYLPRESGDVGKMQGEILRVPPGITGPWQVSGRNHAPFEKRIQMDARYVRDWSVWMDLVLLARTVRSMFGGGAY